MMTTPATPKSPPLSDYLCFAVYSANLAFGRAYRPILEPLGLTYTQYVALVALWEQDDQTVGDLGEKLFLESNTLTPLLKKLEQMGFLERRRDPADERQVRIRLTKKGRDLQNECISDRLIDATGLDSDFTRLRTAIAGLRDNLLASTAA